MTIKSSLINLQAIIIVLSTLLSMPVFAVDEEVSKRMILEYQDIEKYILQENIQLKSCKAAVDKLKNKIDAADEDSEEAEDSLYDLARSINGVINTLNSIIGKYDPGTDPDGSSADVVAIAQAVKLSLSLTQENLYAQIDILDDSTDGLSDQLDLSEVSYEQAKGTLINTGKNLFMLYHQLTYNLEQLEFSHAQLTDQLALINKNIELGLAAQLSAIDMQTSLFELDASFAALTHQKDYLLLQLKVLLGLSYKDELSLGELPNVDLSAINDIEFDKDIANAVKNAMSTKVKAAELTASSITGNRKKYELEIKENEAVLNFTKKYHSLLEARDNLRVSENKLNAAKLKLEQGQKNFDKGLLSETALNSLRNDVEINELKVKSDLALLFIEIENYKAMEAGML